MARDHRKLRAFQNAHRLTVAIYKYTKSFPKDEWFGLRAQMRRSAVSIATNIVEGSARRTTKEYLNFLNVARGSGAEVAYLVDLTFELELLAKDPFVVLARMCSQLVPQLESLVQQVAQLVAEERRARRMKNLKRSPSSQRLKPGA
jgi:four helix bundle protein